MFCETAAATSFFCLVTHTSPSSLTYLHPTSTVIHYIPPTRSHSFLRLSRPLFPPPLPPFLSPSLPLSLYRSIKKQRI